MSNSFSHETCPCCKDKLLCDIYRMLWKTYLGYFSLLYKIRPNNIYNILIAYKNALKATLWKHECLGSLLLDYKSAKSSGYNHAYHFFSWFHQNITSWRFFCFCCLTQPYYNIQLHATLNWTPWTLNLQV